MGGGCVGIGVGWGGGYVSECGWQYRHFDQTKRFSKFNIGTIPIRKTFGLKSFSEDCDIKIPKQMQVMRSQLEKLSLIF